jgi:hypothetical protein
MVSLNDSCCSRWNMLKSRSELHLWKNAGPGSVSFCFPAGLEVAK